MKAITATTEAAPTATIGGEAMVVETGGSQAERLAHAIGPVAGGLVLDFVDLATFGPIGLVLGGLVGGLTGFWLSGLYRFQGEARGIWALVAAIYCTIPFTAILPFATLLGAAGRYWEPVRVREVGQPASASEPEEEDEGPAVRHIEAEA